MRNSACARTPLSIPPETLAGLPAPARVGANPVPTTQALVCPRCRVASLRERTRSGVPIDVCAECGGIWLDRGELQRLLSSRFESPAGPRRTDRSIGGAPHIVGLRRPRRSPD